MNYQQFSLVRSYEYNLLKLLTKFLINNLIFCSKKHNFHNNFRLNNKTLFSTFIGYLGLNISKRRYYKLYNIS